MVRRRFRFHKRQRRFNRFHKNHKRHSPISTLFYRINRFVRRHPILSSVISILIGIFLIRAFFMNTIFGNKITEIRGWILFFAILFIIIGLIALNVWFRRNVPHLFTKHDVNWRNR